MDLANATENALLEITALDLGGVWLAVTPDQERVDKVAKVLGTPETLVPFALVPFGYPAEERHQQDRYDEARIHYIG